MHSCFNIPVLHKLLLSGWWRVITGRTGLKSFQPAHTNRYPCQTCSHWELAQDIRIRPGHKQRAENAQHKGQSFTVIVKTRRISGKSQRKREASTADVHGAKPASDRSPTSPRAMGINENMKLGANGLQRCDAAYSSDHLRATWHKQRSLEPNRTIQQHVHSPTAVT